MTKKELADVLKYTSPNIIYVVTWNNILKKVFCPFKVIVLGDIGDLRKGDVVLVEAVKVDLSLKTIFIIENQAYYYHNFEILID
jgi:predicted component of type VI protein secretion system